MLTNSHAYNLTKCIDKVSKLIWRNYIRDQCVTVILRSIPGQLVSDESFLTVQTYRFKGQVGSYSTSCTACSNDVAAHVTSVELSEYETNLESIKFSLTLITRRI